MQEIAVYDDYVKSKLDELNICTSENAKPELKISNVVFENKKLMLQLDVAKMEIDNLRQLLDAMTDLNSCGNQQRNDTSVADIQILNQMLSKNKQPHSNQSSQRSTAKSTPNSVANDLPSVKLFKRMITLKKENNDL